MRAAGLSDLGSGMRVYTLVLLVMTLTSLDDSGRGKILWIAAELHPVQRGSRMEIWRLVLVYTVTLSCCQLLLMLL